MHDFDDYPCKRCNGIILDRDFFERNATKINFGVALFLLVIAFIIKLWN